MSDQPLSSGVYKAWLAAHPDKKGSDDYKAVEANFIAAGGRSDEIEALTSFMRDKSTSQIERLGGALAYVWYKGQELMKSAGTKGAPAAVGQIVGKRLGGGVGARVGAGIGAFAGSVADQARRGQPIRAGETLGDVGAAVANPRGVWSAAATNVGAEVFQQLVDEGHVSPDRVAASTGMAMAGQKLANRLEKGLPVEIHPDDTTYAFRYRALQDVKPYGISISPGEIERGSEMFNRFAGVNATAILASKRNQNAFQRMVREQGGFELDEKKLKLNSLAFEPSTRRYGIDLEDGEIDLQVKKAAAPYREIKEISNAINEETKLLAEQKLKNGKYVTSYTTPEGLEAMRGAGVALDKLKVSHRAIRDEYKKMDSGDPNAFQRIQALKEQVKAMESEIDAAAVAAAAVNPSHKNLLARLNESRVKIAELRAIDTATDTNGLVSPRILALQRDSGVPVTNNLEKLALFHNAFKMSARNSIEAGPLQFEGATPAYTARNAAVGNTTGLLSGGFPFLSEGAREYLMSKGAQNRFSTPRVGIPASPAGTLVRQGSMLASVGNDSEDQP